MNSQHCHHGRQQQNQKLKIPIGRLVSKPRQAEAFASLDSIEAVAAAAVNEFVLAYWASNTLVLVSAVEVVDVDGHSGKDRMRKSRDLVRPAQYEARERRIGSAWG